MEALEGVRTRGFKRWYERQLIESHAYFITCFACMIAVAAILEVLNLRDASSPRLMMLVLACAGGGVGAFSWRRYQSLLRRAERIAEAAVCTRCDTYGAFRVIDWGPRRGTAQEPAEPYDDDRAWLKVSCRKCQHEWLIE